MFGSGPFEVLAMNLNHSHMSVDVPGVAHSDVNCARVDELRSVVPQQLVYPW
jgi:hypothetical protein